MNAFTPTERSRVKRLHERGEYDEAAVFAILDAGMIAHIAYVLPDGANAGQPFVTPTAYWRLGRRLYWHGSAASRMLRAQARGLPVCFTVTHLDGMVMARSGFHHSINYRSVMAFGTAQIVDDAAEKLRHLDRFVERLFPERTGDIRAATAQELKGTTMVSMEIEEASAKHRVGPPKDDDEDYGLDCWAGVIPIAQVIGAPVDDPKLKAGVAFPGGLRGYAEGARLDTVLSAHAARQQAQEP